LLEELAAAPLPGVVLVTTRFPVPELEHRGHARILTLAGLDPSSAGRLMRSLGVHGTDAELDAAAAMCGRHAKAVELLATYLRRFHNGDVGRHDALPAPPTADTFTAEERQAARILAAFQRDLPSEAQDILALATAFRDPATEVRVLEY